jgi:hypothetical protein
LIGIGLNSSDTQFWQIPFFPAWFYPLGLKGHSRCRGFTLGLRVISQVFQVGNLNTGKILYTFPVNGFTAPAGSTSAHGITISPDEKELYLIDTPNSYAHVFNISGLPNTSPTQAANIQLQGMESPCIYDCAKEGWLTHVGDGRYVVVGDSGDIIDTTTRTIFQPSITIVNSLKSTAKTVILFLPQLVRAWDMSVSRRERHYPRLLHREYQPQPRPPHRP